MSDVLDYGQVGVYITSTEGVVTGSFSIIKALEDSAIIINTNWKNAPDDLELIVSNGDERYGVFSKIQVSSGSVVAYTDR